jgi:hypothetical protein
MVKPGRAFQPAVDIFPTVARQWGAVIDDNWSIADVPKRMCQRASALKI